VVGSRNFWVTEETASSDRRLAKLGGEDCPYPLDDVEQGSDRFADKMRKGYE